MILRRLGFLVAIVLACAELCVQAGSGPAIQADTKSADVPRFDGLGGFGRKLATSNHEAQRYFDQGLCFLYAFNHDEAIRSFRRAAELDPQLAMPWWGIALANGPHINNPMVDESHARAAWQALAKSRELAGNAAPVERALIKALHQRYADPQPDDRTPTDQP